MERIYTKTALFKQKIVVRVSNSNGEIYTLQKDVVETMKARFKLQRRNLHEHTLEDIRELELFQTPTEKFTRKNSLRFPLIIKVSNSSGENLHRVRNSIFPDYEYLKFIFLPLKFR